MAAGKGELGKWRRDAAPFNRDTLATSPSFASLTFQQGSLMPLAPLPSLQAGSSTATTTPPSGPFSEAPQKKSLHLLPPPSFPFVQGSSSTFFPPSFPSLCGSLLPIPMWLQPSHPYVAPAPQEAPVLQLLFPAAVPCFSARPAQKIWRHCWSSPWERQLHGSASWLCHGAIQLHGNASFMEC
eukprot:357650-Chlamydomonas_euryale.AAC.10